jgi:hypothetical protein
VTHDSPAETPAVTLSIAGDINRHSTLTLYSLMSSCASQCLWWRSDDLTQFVKSAVIGKGNMAYEGEAMCIWTKLNLGSWIDGESDLRLSKIYCFSHNPFASSTFYTWLQRITTDQMCHTRNENTLDTYLQCISLSDYGMHGTIRFR